MGVTFGVVAFKCVPRVTGRTNADRNRVMGDESMAPKRATKVGVSDLPWEVSSRLFVIAEIGINHNGDLGLAKELISVASGAGCDAVKFQKREPDICVPEAQKGVLRDTPWGRMTYLEYKKRIEFGVVEYDEIDSFCRELGLAWSASAWDIPSQHFLRRYSRQFNKVASAMVTDLEFLRVVAAEGLKTYISTGMSSLDEIDRAVGVFIQAGTEFELMHSVSTYPAKDEHLNLLTILTLRERYGVPVGYSGHEASVSPSVAAVVLGASSLERHITLDRAMWGTDQAASLEPPGLQNLVGAVRKIPLVLGDGVKRVLQEEALMAAKLRRH